MYESLKEYFRTRGILLVIVIKARQTLRRHDHGWYLYKINFHWLSPLSIYTALQAYLEYQSIQGRSISGSVQTCRHYESSRPIKHICDIER